MISFTDPDADFSGRGLPNVLPFLPFDPYAAYLMGSAYEDSEGLGAAFDRTGNGRHLSMNGAAVDAYSVRVADSLFPTTPFTPDDLVGVTGLTIITVAKVPTGHTALALAKSNDTGGTFTGLVHSTTTLIAQQEDETTSFKTTTLTAIGECLDRFSFYAGAFGSPSPDGSGQTKVYAQAAGGLLNATGATAQRPTGVNVFRIGDSSGVPVSQSDIAASAFYSRLLTSAEVSAVRASLAAQIAANGGNFNLLA